MVNEQSARPRGDGRGAPEGLARRAEIRSAGSDGHAAAVAPASRGRRPGISLFPLLLLLLACQRREPFDAARAEKLVRARAFRSEPVYAEVPQRVWWNERAPKDGYDERALRTLRNLERAGYVTVTESSDGGTTSYTASVTEKGYRLLGTAPSARGPVYRALIAEKRFDGLRNFRRHPTDPNVAYADLVWHYEKPTPRYELFETKINKPLHRPFTSMVSFFYRDYEWRFQVTVVKGESRG